MPAAAARGTPPPKHSAPPERSPAQLRSARSVLGRELAVLGAVVGVALAYVFEDQRVLNELLDRVAAGERRPQPRERARELRRVYDICHGCRRCFNLCDSFPRLFDMIDESKTGELDSVDKAEYAKTLDSDARKAPDPYFNRLDVNRDGFISKDEYLNPPKQQDSGAAK